MNAQRLLVISDIHGHVRELEAVLNWAQDHAKSGGIDAAVFLGDGAADLKRITDVNGFSCEWKLVRGNNDFDSSLPLGCILDCGGHRFFLCHGHQYALYSGYDTLAAAAANLDAEAVLFGHAHVPCYKKYNNILMINPGSIGFPRSNIGATFAVVLCEPGKSPEAEFWGIGGQYSIKRLSGTVNG